MSLKRIVPNFITLLNLLSGSLAVILTMEGQELLAVLLIVLAAIFDFLDGFSARALKAYSQLGKELDSLADLISFGLAPSLLIYQRVSSLLATLPQESLPTIPRVLLSFSPLIITICSALRLALFNIDTNQKKSFTGVPTPAAALWVALFIHYTHFSETLTPLTSNPLFYPFASIVIALLLVVKIEMFSLKIESLKYRDSATQYNFLIISALLLPLSIIWGEVWSLWPLLVLTLYPLYNIVKSLSTAGRESKTP